MNELLEKISSYNVFNYLFPGILYAVLSTYSTKYDLILDDVVIGAFIYYFYGLLISRFGSLVIARVFERYKLIVLAPKDKYIAATKIDVKIDILNAENNMYRTLIAVCICVVFTMLFEQIADLVPFLTEYHAQIGVLGLIILLYLSHKKVTKNIAERIEISLSSKGARNDDSQ